MTMKQLFVSALIAGSMLGGCVVRARHPGRGAACAGGGDASRACGRRAARDAAYDGRRRAVAPSQNASRA